MRSGEFREAFLSLAAEVHDELGDPEGAARTRGDVLEDYNASVAREKARILPKLPILGPMVAVKITDWPKTLDSEGAKAEKDGKPPLKAMAAKVRELAPDVPPWIKVVCALVMAAGTSVGGWRIIKTMGHKMVKLQPVHGFAAETTAATLLACSPSVELILIRIHLAPLISLSFSNGEFIASSIALCALSSPAASAFPNIATPPLRITVHTSAKSTLICPVLLITSVIHFAAVASTLSAFAKASLILRFPY